MRGPRRSAAAIFAWPVAVATVTCIGLAAGLMGEGGWDRLAWAGLLLPALVALRSR